MPIQAVRQRSAKRERGVMAENREDRRERRVNTPYQPDSYSYSPGNDI